MFCHQCGNFLETHHKYCTKCGKANDTLIESDTKKHFLDSDSHSETNLQPNRVVQLHAAIKSCLLNRNNADAKERLIAMLKAIIITKEDGIEIINQFYQYYQLNLIFQITEITTEFSVQKQYLQKFINLNIIDKEYPYLIIEESIKVIEPISDSLSTNSSRILSLKSILIIAGILICGYYVFVPSNSSPSLKSQASTKHFKIQENISVGNFIYYINNYRFYKKDDGAIFVEISLDIFNQSNESRISIGSLCQLIDESGKTYDVSVEEGLELTMSGKNDLFLTQINPGISKTGSLVFEIPKRKPYYLILSGGALNNHTKRVLIQ